MEKDAVGVFRQSFLLRDSRVEAAACAGRAALQHHQNVQIISTFFLKTITKRKIKIITNINTWKGRTQTSSKCANHVIQSTLFLN